MSPSEAGAAASTSVLAPYRALLLRRPGDKRDFAIIVGLLFVASFLELAGLGLVIPFVRLIDQGAGAPSNPMLARVFRLLAPYTPVTQVAIAGGALVGTFLVKNAFLAFANRVQMTLLHAHMVRTSRDLLSGYLAVPYDFHLKRSPTQLARIVTVSLSDVYRTAVPHLLIFLSEALTCGIVALFLIALEPGPLIATVVGLGLIGALAQRFYSKRMTSYGNVYRAASERALQWGQQSLSSIKEAKVAGRESFFTDRFHDAMRSQGDSLTSFRSVIQFPRLLLECAAVAGLVAIALLVLARGESRERLVVVLGVLAVAFVRLLPSAVRVMGSFNEVRYYSPSAAEAAAELAQVEAAPRDVHTAVEHMPLVTSLALANVTYKYPASEDAALRDVTFSIARGESVAFVGPSGAGKTTLVDVLSGLLFPNAGAVELDGQPLDREGLRRWRRSIGYVPQFAYILDDTLRRNVAFGREEGDIDEAEVWKALDAAQLTDVVKAMPEGLDTRLGERGVRLSGGQRQRLAIARALYGNPDFLVFDEATSSLDGVTEKEVMQAIEQLRGVRTLVLVAHRLSTVRFCDRLVYLEHGQVQAVGSWAQLLHASEGFRALVSAAEVEHA